MHTELATLIRYVKSSKTINREILLASLEAIEEKQIEIKPVEKPKCLQPSE